MTNCIVLTLLRVTRERLADRLGLVEGEKYSNAVAVDEHGDYGCGTRTNVRSPRSEYGTERPRGERGVRTVSPPSAAHAGFDASAATYYPSRRLARNRFPNDRS